MPSLRFIMSSLSPHTSVPPSEMFYFVNILTLCRLDRGVNLPPFILKVADFNIWYDMIYLLTVIGLAPGGSSRVHIYTQTIHRTKQLTTTKKTQQKNNTINNKNNTINNIIGKSAGRAPSLRTIPWHLPYNWRKGTEKPKSG